MKLDTRSIIRTRILRAAALLVIAAVAAACVPTAFIALGAGTALADPSPGAHPEPEPRPEPLGEPVPQLALPDEPQPEAPPEPAPADTRIAASDAALDALAPHVHRMSDPGALRTAFRAYYSYREANPHAVRKPYLYFVDFGLPNNVARGFVFDMESLTVVDGPFTVAHGRGSSKSRNGVPESFSNRSGSYATSLGLYLAEETYTFRGRANGRAYSSVGLRMRGESGRFNSAARARGIVAHGAPYVTAVDAGRSEGCPAMEPARAERLLPMIANGGVVFHYSPRDIAWIETDPWVTAVEN